VNLIARREERTYESPQELKIFEIANTLLDVINCVPSLTIAKSALMTQGPHDVFHSLSYFLATLSGGQSKTLALLQGKMAEAKLPFQQIPRFIELEEGRSRSPVSVEPAYANSPPELPYEFERRKLRTTPTSAPVQLIYKYSENSAASVWMDGTAPPQLTRPGISRP
jgi:hypothetical protein